MSKSHENKSKFLGQTFNSAVHQLKRKIMFDLIEKAGMNFCFRCGNPMTIEDFSIDHKKSWLYVSVENFWNLDNIAFSHKKCNVTDRPAYSNKAPEGTGWCSECKKFLPLEHFGYVRNKTDTRGYCKVCRNKRRKEGKSY